MDDEKEFVESLSERLALRNLKADIAYDELVQTMDVVRVADVVQAASVVKVELFPLISIGDAPPANDKVAAAAPR